MQRPLGGGEVCESVLQCLGFIGFEMAKFLSAGERKGEEESAYGLVRV